MRNVKRLLLGTAITVLLALSGAGAQQAAAAPACVLPAGNAAQQWDEIAQKTVLSVVTFQNESFIYMAYANGAAYRAVFGGPLSFLASPDAAIATAEYDVLSFYFPAQTDAAPVLPRRVARDSAGRARQDLRDVRRPRGCGHDDVRADRRRTHAGRDDPARLSGRGPRRLAADAAGVSAATDPVARSDAPVPAESAGSVPAAASACSRQLRRWVQGLQRDQGDGPRDGEPAHSGADGHRAVLHDQRGRPVQHGVPRRRDPARLRRLADDAARRPGEPRCGGHRDRVSEREVPLLVLAAGDGAQRDRTRRSPTGIPRRSRRPARGRRY